MFLCLSWEAWEEQDPTIDNMFQVISTTSLRQLRTAGGVVIKLDAGDLAVDYFDVASERICTDSPSSRHVFNYAYALRGMYVSTDNCPTRQVE